MKKISQAVLLIAAIAASASAFAATAIWTGEMKQVQTVTYKMAWSCKYMYAGNYFWMVFEGSCPSSVEIQ